MNSEKKLVNLTILGKFVKSHNKTLIGLSLSKNIFHRSKFKALSNDIFFSWTFDLLLIWIYLWSLFLTTLKQYGRWIQTSWETNHKVKTNIFACLWYWCWKNLFLNVKFKLLIYFDFPQFYEHIFRSNHTQMFFKLAALKSFVILRIKKRLQHSCFPIRSSH